VEVIARAVDGSRTAWPACVFVTVRDGLIVRTDEYVDRPGYDPDADAV
jgi:ketosteroid isomerase-like protein